MVEVKLPQGLVELVGLENAKKLVKEAEDKKAKK